MALALFAFIILTETRRQPAPATKLTDEPIAPRLRPATVTRVELIRTNLNLSAELLTGQWRLTQPVVYPANTLLLKTLLDVCARLRPQHIIPPEQVKSLADFGLDPPQATLRFHQGGAPVELRIGARTPVTSQLYLQVAGTPHVVVADVNLLEFLPRTADDWRDRQLLSLTGVKFDRLNLLRAGARELRFQRNPTNNQWRIVAPTPPRRANAAQIEELLATLMRWPVQEFVSDRPDADLEPYGLAKPETEVAFGIGTNDALVVQFGRSPTNQPGLVYARNLTTTNVVLVPAELLAQLRAPVWDFSEHRLLDPLSAGQFDLIEVRGRETFTLRRQTNGTNNAGWVAENPARTPTDPQLMQSFLLNLETLEAHELEKEVVTDYSPYGLATPARSVALLQSVTNTAGAATNRLVARLDFGVVPNLPPDRMFARRHDEGSVYVVPRGDVENLAWALWQVQDRAVWNFASNAVTAVTVEFDGRSRRLTRSGDGRWSEAGQPVEDVRNVALEETTFRLGQLRAERWVHLGADRLPIYGISETRHRVSIELAGTPAKTNVVTLGFIPQGRNPWAAITDPRTGQPLIFECPRPLFMDYIVPYLSPSK